MTTVSILCDTNVLLAAASTGDDLLERLRGAVPSADKIVVMECVVAELDKLGAGGGKSAQDARLAKSLITHKGITTIADGEGSYADEKLIARAAERDVVVATIDKEIQSQLKSKGLPYVLVRKSGHPVLVGHIREE